MLEMAQLREDALEEYEELEAVYLDIGLPLPHPPHQPACLLSHQIKSNQWNSQIASLPPSLPWGLQRSSPRAE